MITLYPFVTLERTGPNDANGTNWPFFATASSNHPHAAGIIAQEISESRFKSNLGLAVGVPAAALFAWLVPAPDYFAIFPLFAGFFLSTIPAIRRKLELRGQMIECLVIAGQPDRYGKTLAEMVEANADQLTGYDQFDGWSKQKIALALYKKQPAAEKWIKANRSLINKCYAV